MDSPAVFLNTVKFSGNDGPRVLYVREEVEMKSINCGFHCLMWLIVLSDLCLPWQW
jgi:hypothetical protein